MPNPPSAFADLGAYLKSYKLLVEKNDMPLAPSIVSALDKLDANKDAGKRKALVDAAVAAITKWDATWTDENKKVTDQKDKLARSQFAVEIRKMKQALEADPKAPPPPPPPPPAPPYKKTTLGADFLKARAEVPFGAAAVALWDLDNAATLADAKPLAAAAQKALEKEAADVDADVKSTKDTDRKLKVSQYGGVVRKLLATVKDLAK